MLLQSSSPGHHHETCQSSDFLRDQSFITVDYHVAFLTHSLQPILAAIEETDAQRKVFALVIQNHPYGSGADFR